MFMKVPTMIYRPGSEYTSNDGVHYDTNVVDESEVEGMVKKGWFKHYKDFPAPPVKKKAAVKKAATKKAAKK